jgi:hypothetical protein
MNRLLRKPVTWVVLVVVVAGMAVGLALFEPWRLFTSSHLDEPVPVAAEQEAPPATDTPAEDTPAGETPAAETP